MKGPGVKQQSNQGVCRARAAVLAGKPNVTVKGTLDIRHRFGPTALAPLTYWLQGLPHLSSKSFPNQLPLAIDL